MFSPRWSGYSSLGGLGAGALSALAQFSHTLDVPLPPGSAIPVPFNTTDVTQGGITVVDPGTGPTRLTVTSAGIYRFDLSLQLLNAGGQSSTVTFWPALNGSNVPNSASSVEVGNNATRLLPYVSIILTVAASQYVEWYVLTTGPNTSVEHFPAVVGPPAVPAIPSAIAGVYRLG